jgi:predicted aspartyl protease
MLINVDRLREEILAKYETQQAFAKKIKYAETQITRALKTQSPKFLLACKKAGIDIDGLMREQRDLEAENKDERLIAALRRIRELERLVDDQKGIIEYYKSIISKK